MKPHEQFKIGDWVQACGYMIRTCTNDIQQVVWKRCFVKATIIGQIVGATYRLIGHINPGTNGGWSPAGYYEDSEQTTFTETGRIFVWQVRIGLMNKPIEVLATDLKVVPAPSKGLPRLSLTSNHLAQLGLQLEMPLCS